MDHETTMELALLTIAKLTDRLDFDFDCLTGATNRIEALKKEKEELETTIETLKEENNFLKVEVSKKDEYAQLNLKLMNSLNEKKDLIEKLTLENKQLKSQIKINQDEIKALRERIEQISIQAKTNEIEELKRDLVRELESADLGVLKMASDTSDFQKKAITLLNNFLAKIILGYRKYHMCKELLSDYCDLLEKYNINLATTINGEEAIIR